MVDLGTCSDKLKLAWYHFKTIQQPEEPKINCKLQLTNDENVKWSSLGRHFEQIWLVPMPSYESACRRSEPSAHQSTTSNTSTCCYCWCKWPLIEAGTFWESETDYSKSTFCQRFLTLPTPNLSHPTASLGWLLCGLCGLLLCGLCGSQMSRFPIYPIWLKTLVGHVDVPCRLKQKYQQVPHLHEEKTAFRVEHLPGLRKLKTTDSNSWYLSHATYLVKYIEILRSWSKAKAMHNRSFQNLLNMSEIVEPTCLTLGSKRRTKFGLCNVHFSTQVSSLYRDPPSDTP